MPQASHNGAERPLLAVLTSAKNLARAYQDVHMTPNEQEKAALMEVFATVFPEKAETLRVMNGELSRSVVGEAEYTPKTPQGIPQTV